MRMSYKHFLTFPNPITFSKSNILLALQGLLIRLLASNSLSSSNSSSSLQPESSSKNTALLIASAIQINSSAKQPRPFRAAPAYSSGLISLKAASSFLFSHKGPLVGPWDSSSNRPMYLQHPVHAAECPPLQTLLEKSLLHAKNSTWDTFLGTHIRNWFLPFLRFTLLPLHLILLQFNMHILLPRKWFLDLQHLHQLKGR